jgi:hypothetical protein
MGAIQAFLLLGFHVDKVKSLFLAPPLIHPLSQPVFKGFTNGAISFYLVRQKTASNGS